MREPGYEHPESYYLLKTEPGDYSYDDLEKDGSTVWDGVRNYAALKHMREVREGDKAFIYHTGNQRRIVGVARVTSDAYPAPEEDDAKIVVFDVEPEERLESPVSLSAVKDDPAFSDWSLVNNPRLSAMPVPPELWEKVLEMSRG